MCDDRPTPPAAPPPQWVIAHAQQKPRLVRTPGAAAGRGPASKPPGTVVAGTGATSLSGCDPEGRPFDFGHVVVNFANVGSTYGERVLKRNRAKNERMFDYEGVRRCVRHLTRRLGLAVIGVCYENYKGVRESGGQDWHVPNDIASMCESVELTPRIKGQHHKSADDEMTIKCAYRRNCRFLDNDNYSDWKASMRDGIVRTWLETCQDLLQMRYYFDAGLGEFDTLDGNMPVAMLAEGAGAGRRPMY